MVRKVGFTMTKDEKLRKALAEIADLEKVIKATPARVQTPAKAFMVHLKDLSSQCDGSNKTFSVGGTHFGIIGVYSTQFPVNFRPIIDYTVTRTGFVFTSAVSAPQSDQTLVCQFLK